MRRIPLMLVASKQCKNCLLTDNKLVSDERRDQILSDIERIGGKFICHCSSHGEGAVKDVCCRGFYEMKKRQHPKLQMMEDKGHVQFVDLPSMPEAIAFKDIQKHANSILFSDRQ